MTEKAAPKNRAPRTAWKAGQSGNPKGAPKRGESWAETIKQVCEMTPKELADLLGARNELGRQFRQMPQDVTMKQLIIARVCAALMFEPQAGLFNALMERAEGKVTSTLDVTSGGDKLGPTVIIFKDADNDSNDSANAPQAAGSRSGGEKI